MGAKVILNPYSGRWQARERWPEAERTLQAANVKFDLAVTEYRRHAVELAEQATHDGYSSIIVAGGDGTIGEVVNGLMRAAGPDSGQIGPLGIIPLGTANDLVCNLNLPTTINEAVDVIARGETKVLDLLQVNDLYFANNSAIGLEPLVSNIQHRMVWAKGLIRYLLAALVGISQRPQWDVEMEWDSGSYTGKMTLVSVGNCPRTGGLFYMTPNADPFDGKLTFTYGYAPKRRDMIGLLPKAMKPAKGNYVEDERFHQIDATWLKIRLKQPSPAHFDGEIFSEAITEVDYRIHPQKLNIYCS